MAYSKQTWATGDTITAEKLNHMEDGIGDFIIGYNITAYNAQTGDITYTRDKTNAEIIEAYNNGKSIKALIIHWEGAETLGLNDRYIPLQTAYYSDATDYAFVFSNYYPAYGTKVGSEDAIVFCDVKIELYVEEGEEGEYVTCELRKTLASFESFPSV